MGFLEMFVLVLRETSSYEDRAASDNAAAAR